MKKLILAAFVLSFSFGSFAQTSVKETAKPVTETPTASDALTVKEEVYDFGKIPQGKPVHHDFVVTNTGTTPLKLGNVQASCGCTTPEWDKENAILPGGTSVIKVGYNAQAEGPFSKAITITYNDTATKIITIKGEVWKTPASSAPENTSVNDLKN